MKNKIFRIILPLFILLIAPMTANAAAFSTSVSCKDTTVGTASTCTISGTISGSSASGVHVNISVSGSASFKSFVAGSGWQGGGDTSVDIYTDVNKSGTFTIGTVTYNANSVGTGSISVSGVVASDADFNDVNGSGSSRSFKINAVPTTAAPQTTTQKVTTAVKTTTRVTNTVAGGIATTTTSTTTTAVAQLKPISVKVDDFEVAFQNGSYYATVNKDTESVMVEATAADGVTIIGTGKRGLAEGKNVVELILRDLNGNSSTYQVIITRPNGSGISDTKLTSLKVVGYDIDFNPDIKEYTVSVPFGSDEVYIIANSYTNDVIIKGDGLITLDKNGKDVVITATYGDLSVTSYTIRFKRSYAMIFMYVISGILGVGLIGSIVYSFIAKKKAVEKAVAEKNKVIANETRSTLNKVPDAQIELNGQKVTGIGRRTVVPTVVAQPQTVVAQPQTVVAQPQTVVTPVQPEVVKQSVTPVQTVTTPVMVSSAPEPQVKVVKRTVVPVHEVQTVQTASANYTGTPDIVVSELNK